MDGWCFNEISSRFKEKESFENTAAFPLALKWHIWNFSDISPFLEGIKKQFEGTEKLL